MNNKGMTLMELIIGMVIATVVMFAGYMIINKSYTIASDQSNVNDVQNGINISRNMLTKDLKYCKDVSLEYSNNGTRVNTSINDKSNIKLAKDNLLAAINNDSNTINEYKYNILVEENGVVNTKSYTINIFNKKNKKLFSLSKNAKNGQATEIIVGQKLTQNSIPFDIKIKDNESMYTINLNYENRKSSKNYTFDIYNDLIKASPGLPDITVERPVNKLLDAYLEKSRLLIKQANLENRGNYFLDDFNNILNKLDSLNANDSEILNKTKGIKSDIEKVMSKWQDKDHGNKSRIMEFLKGAINYLDIIIYILENENYMESPDLTNEFVNSLLLGNRKNKYQISLDNIIGKLREDQQYVDINRLNEYLNRSVSSKLILELVSEIEKIYNNDDDSIYNLNNNLRNILNGESYVEEIEEIMEEVIYSLIEVNKDNISIFREQKNGEYIYFANNTNNNKINRECALNLISNIEQNIRVSIEELKYLKFMIGR